MNNRIKSYKDVCNHIRSKKEFLKNMRDLLHLNPISISATTIPDAWFQALRTLLDKGNRYITERGSFEGEQRIEFDHITLHIKYPFQEPYNLMLPDIPLSIGIPSPISMEYLEYYLPYVLTPEIKIGETYTYGNKITDQVELFIEILKNSPNTNQAILQVARPSDKYLTDPPCLRHIDLRIKAKALHFFPYFRSWDLWAGLPANLAALAVLQKHMADEIGVECGEMIAASKCLHIDGYGEDLSKMRCYFDGEKE